MGWTSIPSRTQAEIVAEIIAPSEKFRTLAHRREGAVLWTVHESKLETPEWSRWVGCYLFEGRSYKGMSEIEGPYYYTCPLSFLDMVPEPSSRYAAGWRAKVRAYHAAREAQMGADNG